MPGILLDLVKSSPSVTVGKRGPLVNLGKHGANVIVLLLLAKG